MRIAIYTRLSPNPDKDDTTNQIRQLEEYCKHQKWEITETYTDIHVSGSKKGIDRPQFKRMMEDARKRKFDLLLFWSLDRLSREGAYITLQYLNQLASYGVDYKSYTEQYLDSCGVFKEAVISIMAVVAKQERIRLIERTIAGLQTARARGKRLGRPKCKVDLEEATRLRNEGTSLRSIAGRYDVSEATICRLLKGVQSV